MLRDCNATYAGKRILASPYVGIIAATIAAETADGDHGPGILYNEAMDPAYAGKYLRAWITNPPAVGSLSVAENGTIEGYNLPAGINVFNYDLIVDDVYDSSSYFEVTVGAVNASAAGVTLTGTASIEAGAASGEVNATAPGIELTGTASLAPGSATGETVIDATAPGVELTGTATLSAGSAAGEINASAPGAELTGTASLDPGTAIAEDSGSATAPGAVLTETSDILAGTATGEIFATAPGATLTGSADIIAGTASGNLDATAPGAELNGTSSLVAGSATDGTAILEPGPAAWWVRSLPRDWTVRALPRSWTVRSTKRTAIGEIMPLPVKDPEEVKTITFDFSADAETISDATITPAYLSGAADSTPADVLAGSRTITGPLVMQRVKTGQDGTNYVLRAKGIDADGEVHIISVALPVRAAVPQ